MIHLIHVFLLHVVQIHNVTRTILSEYVHACLLMWVVLQTVDPNALLTLTVHQI